MFILLIVLHINHTFNKSVKSNLHYTIKNKTKKSGQILNES